MVIMVLIHEKVVGISCLTIAKAEFMASDQLLQEVLWPKYYFGYIYQIVENATSGKAVELRA